MKKPSEQFNSVINEVKLTTPPDSWPLDVLHALRLATRIVRNYEDDVEALVNVAQDALMSLEAASEDEHSIGRYDRDVYRLQSVLRRFAPDIDPTETLKLSHAERRGDRAPGGDREVPAGHTDGSQHQGRPVAGGEAP